MKGLLLLLSSSLLLVGCRKEELGQSDQDLQVRSEQAVVVVLPQGKAQLLATISEDSRCPIGVQCFWAGRVTVQAQLRAETDSTRTVDLCLGACAASSFHQRDSAAVTLTGQPYWLYLLDVSPYPSAGTSPRAASRRITMRIRPR